MNINPINMYNQNFQARIKMNPANLKTIATASSAIGAAAALTASAANDPIAIADSSFSGTIFASLMSTLAEFVSDALPVNDKNLKETKDKKTPC